MKKKKKDATDLQAPVNSCSNMYYPVPTVSFWDEGKGCLGWLLLLALFIRNETLQLKNIKRSSFSELIHSISQTIVLFYFPGPWLGGLAWTRRATGLQHNSDILHCCKCWGEVVSIRCMQVESNHGIYSQVRSWFASFSLLAEKRKFKAFTIVLLPKTRMKSDTCSISSFTSETWSITWWLMTAYDIRNDIIFWRGRLVKAATDCVWFGCTP